MRAVLSAEIPVERFAVFAEMAWLERRPELGLLCRAAMKQGDRVSIVTVQSALPGLPDAGASNVMTWCQVLGLCDAQGGLTELGKDVAESDEAPVPEQGTYGFWMAQHPLLGRRILVVERLTSNRDHRFDAIEPLNVEPDRGVVFRSVINPDERYMLRHLPTNHGKSGCLRGATEATCRLRWTLDFDAGRDQWQLDGLVEAPQGGMMPLKHQPEIDGIDLWALAANWGATSLADLGRWSTEERRLAVQFSGLTDDEQEAFLKTVKLRYVEVPGKGGYDNVTLNDVPIGPTSGPEAQRWAMSRLTRSLANTPQYRSRSEVRHLFAELTEDTPLEHFGPTLPGHATLIAGDLHAKQPDVFWGLAAPVDLAPHVVPALDLDELTIGRTAFEVTPDSPTVIRIPYRGGWTMRRLADRLLQGASPYRVLLCDRYVRGPSNLAALKLLVSAIHSVDASAKFEVWTGDREADFKQIREITGSQPRSYREAFGRNLPHDRYLLVLPKTGEPFGWHLSNSPLDARADVADASPSTPLRWRDLAGTKVSAEELEPALRQWLSRGAG
jgi:hypothetical protein